MKYIFVFKQSFEKNKKVRKFSIIATYLVIALATIIFLLVAVPKIIFPYEAHWMEGSMLDAISRIQSGIPLFERPSIHYVPWLYQPLYYYITAALTTVSGLSFPVARIPSVLSTLVICSLLYSVVKKESEKQFFAIAAAGLFIASYAKTEYCLVMARVDPLFTVFLIGAVITIFYFRSPFGLITGALLLALSFFTKQTGMVFAPGIILYLWYIRGWKSMMIFLFSFGFFVIVGILIFNAISDGWYYYYTFLVPKGKEKTLRWGYAINGFFIYIFLRC
jgi:4-amino-4-deoxy-L-arabinose transferase-like glycosyltransferase